VWTNYWRTERARAGYYHLSYRAGEVVILVPPRLEQKHLFEEMPPVGTPVEIWQDTQDGTPVYRLLWFTDDAPFDPREITVDRRLWTGEPPEDGRVVPLVWYTAYGDEAAIERRRELVQIGRSRAS